MGEKVVTLMRKGRVARVRINNPPVNSLSRKVLDGLESIFHKIECEDSCTVVVLTGTEECFSAGADLRELAAAMNRTEMEERLKKVKGLLDRMEAFTIPIIGAINGNCLGGGLELALACHIRIADESARFGFPEINLALMPGAGGTQRLRRLAGFSNSCEMILTGELINAKKAFDIGLVDRLTPMGTSLEAARDLAQAIGSKSRAAVISALAAIRYASQSPVQEGMEKETRLFGKLFETEEAKERIKDLLNNQNA